MISMDDKNDMLVMVLEDLAGICGKLADHPGLPETLRAQSRKFVDEFDALLPVKGKGTAAQQAQGERLLAAIARFLPRVLEVQATPRA